MLVEVPVTEKQTASVGTVCFIQHVMLCMLSVLSGFSFEEFRSEVVL